MRSLRLVRVQQDRERWGTGAPALVLGTVGWAGLAGDRGLRECSVCVNARGAVHRRARRAYEDGTLLGQRQSGLGGRAACSAGTARPNAPVARDEDLLDAAEERRGASRSAVASRASPGTRYVDASRTTSDL